MKRIEMPSAEEKERSISRILDAALPAQVSPWVRLHQAARLPLRVLFFGVGDCLVLPLAAFLVLAVTCGIMAKNHAPVLPLLFLLSPALFAGLHGLTAWKEIQLGTWEWKSVCRIDFRTLTVLRMLIFGGFALVLDLLLNLAMWQLSGRSLDLLWTLGFSFASLFLYALATVPTMTRRWGWLIPAVLWLLATVLLAISPRVLLWVTGIPVFALAVLCGLAAVGVACEIKQTMTFPLKGEMNRA